jgi:hypothetical protein
MNPTQRKIWLRKNILLTVWEPVDELDECFVNNLITESEQVFKDARPFVSKYFAPRKPKKWSGRRPQNGKVKIYTKEEIRKYEEDLKNERA